MEFWRYRTQPTAEPVQVAGPPDGRDAFEKGLRQGRLTERARHHRHPLLKLTLIMVGLAGAAILALAAHEGSFSRGGAVVDQNLAVAADNAQVGAAEAAAKAGRAVKTAGDSLGKTVSDAATQH